MKSIKQLSIFLAVALLATPAALVAMESIDKVKEAEASDESNVSWFSNTFLTKKAAGITAGLGTLAAGYFGWRNVSQERKDSLAETLSNHKGKVGVALAILPAAAVYGSSLYFTGTAEQTNAEKMKSMAVTDKERQEAQELLANAAASAVKKAEDRELQEQISQLAPWKKALYVILVKVYAEREQVALWALEFVQKTREPFMLTKEVNFMSKCKAEDLNALKVVCEKFIDAYIAFAKSTIEKTLSADQAAIKAQLPRITDLRSLQGLNLRQDQKAEVDSKLAVINSANLCIENLNKRIIEATSKVIVK